MSATADLYLGFSCADLLRTGQIERLAPTVFRRGQTLIVMRHHRGLAHLPEHSWLIYLIDDDWRGGLVDPSLPPLYRAKLLRDEAWAGLSLEKRADIIVTGSEYLSARYRTLRPDTPVVTMDPAWPDAAMPAVADVPRIAFLGAWSHRADFLFIRPVLEELLETGAEFHLTVTANHPIPACWKYDSRVEVVPALSWPDYRRWMAGRRFDIGLYPCLDGKFNAARSANKAQEYAQFGAALVASQGWAGRHGLGPERCHSLPDCRQAWSDAVSGLIDAPNRIAALAGENANEIRQQRPKAAQRDLWERLFDGGLCP
ncbi:MAG: hypothetical protein HUJ27_15800 [Rhodobacteraceae bacterium]|nr:hypothetical protein [Paracoccaceae bacterium]